MLLLNLARLGFVSRMLEPGWYFTTLTALTSSIRCIRRPPPPPHRLLSPPASTSGTLILGHPNPVKLHRILRSFSFSCNKIEDHTCHARRVCKNVCLPFNNSTTIASFPFQLIHSDVWTSPVPSNSGYLYYLVLLDDYSHYVWTFPLRRKLDALSTLMAFYSYVSTQFGHHILAL